MAKIIRLNVSKEDYEEGMRMMQNAIYLAHSHGYWDNERALEIFGDKGWLPDWNQLENEEDMMRNTISLMPIVEQYIEKFRAEARLEGGDYSFTEALAKLLGKVMVAERQETHDRYVEKSRRDIWKLASLAVILGSIGFILGILCLVM